MYAFDFCAPNDFGYVLFSCEKHRKSCEKLRASGSRYLYCGAVGAYYLNVATIESTVE